MKYYPSYLAFTETKNTELVTIEGENLTSFDLSYSRIVAVTSNKDTLNEVVCISLPVQSFAAAEVTKERIIMSIKINKEISEKLRKCLTNKNQYLALQVDIPTRTASGSITSQQRALLPIFDNTQSNILTTQRTKQILGELTANLRVSPLNCNNLFMLSRKDVTCTTEVTNSTDNGVMASIITSVREALPPGMTLYENIERTNILILPGQSYQLSFVIPKEVTKVFKNGVNVVSTFSSIGSENSGFTVNTHQTIWFLPVQLLTIFVGILLIISAILFRKNIYKFINRNNGSQKATS